MGLWPPFPSLPADVLWGECVTNEPQRTSAGRLPFPGFQVVGKGQRIVSSRKKKCQSGGIWERSGSNPPLFLLLPPPRFLKLRHEKQFIFFHDLKTLLNLKYQSKEPICISHSSYLLAVLQKLVFLTYVS